VYGSHAYVEQCSGLAHGQQLFPDSWRAACLRIPVGVVLLVKHCPVGIRIRGILQPIIMLGSTRGHAQVLELTQAQNGVGHGGWLGTLMRNGLHIGESRVTIERYGISRVIASSFPTFRPQKGPLPPE
jgi:hypothetical protein